MTKWKTVIKIPQAALMDPCPPARKQREEVSLGLINRKGPAHEWLMPSSWPLDQGSHRYRRELGPTASSLKQNHGLHQKRKWGVFSQLGSMTKCQEHKETVILSCGHSQPRVACRLDSKLHTGAFRAHGCASSSIASREAAQPVA